MLASARKTVSLLIIALRLALAGCAAHSPTSRIRTSMQLDGLAAAAGRVALLAHLSDSTSGFRFYVLGPLHDFVLNLGPILISTTVTMLNKILFGLLKFYFTLNNGRKTTFYIFFNFPWYHFVAVTSSRRFFTILYFTLLYLTKILYSRSF